MLIDEKSFSFSTAASALAFGSFGSVLCSDFAEQIWFVQCRACELH